MQLSKKQNQCNKKKLDLPVIFYIFSCDWFPENSTEFYVDIFNDLEDG